MHSVVAVTDPSRTGPNITIYIRPYAVGKTGFALIFHGLQLNLQMNGCATLVDKDIIFK
jgi:hypothetical protein